METERMKKWEGARGFRIQVLLEWEGVGWGRRGDEEGTWCLVHNTDRGPAAAGRAGGEAGRRGDHQEPRKEAVFEQRERMDIVREKGERKGERRCVCVGRLRGRDE